MTTFNNPFAYFVFLSWSFWIMALVVYITVFKISYGLRFADKM